MVGRLQQQGGAKKWYQVKSFLSVSNEQSSTYALRRLLHIGLDHIIGPYEASKYAGYPSKVYV